MRWRRLYGSLKAEQLQREVNERTEGLANCNFMNNREVFPNFIIFFKTSLFFRHDNLV